MQNPFRKNKLKPLISVLEPRMLFDGAVVATAVNTLDNTSYANSDNTDNTTHTITPPASEALGRDSKKEIAFVDSKVEGYEDIINNINPNVKVYTISENSDGLEYITNVLQQEDNVSAIHILGHGSNANVSLGNISLSSYNIDFYTEELTTIKNSLNQDGDILIYGCDVAKNEIGEAFVQELANITSADIAVSSNTTGADGDWILEKKIGTIDTKSMSIDSYKHNLSTPTYIENGSAILLMDNTTNVGNAGWNYSGGYIEFFVNSADAKDQLNLQTDSTPSNITDKVSVIGDTIYIGNGSSSTIIGYINGTYNGDNGNALRVNWSAGFENSSFESGSTNNIPGWVVGTSQIHLDGVDTIAGWATPLDTTWPSSNGSIHDQTTFNAVPTATVSLTTSYHTDGASGLLLDTGSANIAEGFGIIRGPYIYSESTVILQDGDAVSFDWKAMGGGDAYDAYGYLLNVNTGDTINLIDSTGASSGTSTNFATKSVTIDSSNAGEYRFVFVDGSYDASGGRALGASLVIDNIKITQANPQSTIDQAILNQIAKKLTYENSGDLSSSNAIQHKTLTIKTVQADSTAQTKTVSFDVQELNDAPILSNITKTITDTTITDTFSNITGTIIGTDADSSSTLTYDFSDGTSSKVGTYGTLSVASNGSYTYTPNATAINGLTANASDIFTIRTTDNTTATTTATFTVSITGVNDKPVNSLTLTTLTKNEDTPIIFNSANSNLISVNDVDSALITATISIANSTGVLTAVNSGNATITNNNSTTVQITGTVADVNTALNGLTYTPTLNANGTSYTTLTVATTDTSTTDTDTISINITAVDDKPVASAMTATVGPNSKQVFSEFLPNFSDVDNNIATEAVRLELISLPTVGVFEVYKGSGDRTSDSNWVAITDISALTANSGYTLNDGRFVVSMASLNDYRYNAGNNANEITNVNWRVMTLGDTNDTTGWSNTATGVVTILDYADNNKPTISITYPANTTVGNASQPQEVVSYDSNNDPISSITTTNSNNTIVINEDTQTAIITLTYSDDVTPKAYMQSVMQSSNTSLVDFGDPNCYSFGANTDKTNGIIELIIKPKANMYGTTTITFGANDGQKTTQETFTLSVTSVNEKAVSSHFTKTIDEDNIYSFANINPVDIYVDANDINANKDVTDVSYATQMAIIQAQMVSNTPDTTVLNSAIASLVSANYFPQSFVVDTLPTNGDLYLGDNIITSTTTIPINQLSTLTYRPDTNYYGTDSFTWYAVDNDGLATDIKSATFTVNPINDYPTIDDSSNIAGNITDTTTLSQSGIVSFGDVDITNTPSATSTTHLVVYISADNAPLTLTPTQREDIQSAFSIQTPNTNTNNGTINWAYDIDENKLDFLASGETVTAIFRLTVDDSNGGTVSQDVTITINGTNDGLNVNVIDVDGIIQEGNTISDNGSITFTDLDLSDRPTATYTQKSLNAMIGNTPITLTAEQQSDIYGAFSITNVSTNQNNGTIDWDYDITEAKLDFLAKDEIVTVEYTITLDDGHGSVVSKDVTITITGANDPLDIKIEANDKDVSTMYETDSTITTSGTMSIADVDTPNVLTPSIMQVNNSVLAIQKDANGDIMENDILTPNNQKLFEMLSVSKVSMSNINSNEQISWNFNSLGESFDYLSEGEVLSLSYTIKVTDGNDQNTYDTQILTINIVGTNDKPDIIVGSSDIILQSITETNTTLVTNGTISVKDLDTTNIVNTSYTVSLIQKDSNGDVMSSDTNTPNTQKLIDMLSITTMPIDSTTQNGVINWTFDSKMDVFDYLAQDETITITYAITASDNLNRQDTQTVTIVINGTNDKIVASTNDIDVLKQPFGINFVKEIAQEFSDIDTTDVTTFEIQGLPKGLYYDKHTGQIFGKLNDIGTFNVTIIANDGLATTTKTFVIEITAPPKSEAISLGEVQSLLQANDGDLGKQVEIGRGSGNQALIKDVTKDAQVIKIDSNTFDGIKQVEAKKEQTPTKPITNDGKKSDTKDLSYKSADVKINVDKNGQVSLKNTDKSIDLKLKNINLNNEKLVINVQDSKKSAKEIYSGSYANGKKLPDSIKIDPKTGQIIGKIPSYMIDTNGNVDIEITAYNPDKNEMRTLNVQFNINDMKNVAKNQIENGYISLGEQIKSEDAKINNYGNNLFNLLSNKA